MGAAWAPHDARHDYVVVEEVGEAVFQEGWSAAEELRLLEAVARFGPSNWKEVADAVGGGKGLRGCEAHYERVYLGGKDGAGLEGAPLLPRDEVLEEEAVLGRREEEERRREEERLAAAEEVAGLAEEEARCGDGIGGVCEGRRRRKAALAPARVEDGANDDDSGEDSGEGSDEDSDEDFVPVGLEEEVRGDEEEYYELEAGDGEAAGERDAEASPGDDEVERRRRKKGGAVARRRRRSGLDGRSRRRRKLVESDGEAEDEGDVGGTGRVEDVIEAEGAVVEGPGVFVEDRGELLEGPGVVSDAQLAGSDVQRAPAADAERSVVPGIGMEPKSGVDATVEGQEVKVKKRPRVSGAAAVDGSSDAAAGDEKAASGGLSGWFEKRGDFDVEYDDEAEEVLADLVFSPEDSEEEQELKMRILEIYNARLDERERAKHVVVSRGMLDFAAVAAADLAVPPSEREVTNWLARFERILEPKEAALFREAVLAEHRLAAHQARIEQYRALGCRTFADARQYDLDAFDRLRAMGFPPEEAPPPPVWEPPLPSGIAKDPAIGRPAGAIPDLSDENPGCEAVRSILPAFPRSKQRNLTPVNGAGLLSAAEEEVCSALRLLPEDYLFLKKTAMEKAAELESHELDQCGSDDVVIVNVVARESSEVDGKDRVVPGADVPSFSASARFGGRGEATLLGFDVRSSSDSVAAKGAQDDNEVVFSCQSPTAESTTPAPDGSCDVAKSSSVEAVEDSCANITASNDLLAKDSLEADELPDDTTDVVEEKGPLPLFSCSSNAAKMLANAAELPSAQESASEDLGLTPPLRSSEPAVVGAEAALETSSTACQAQSPPACLSAWRDEALNSEARANFVQLASALQSSEVDMSSVAGPSVLGPSTANRACTDGENVLSINLVNEKSPEVTSTPTRSDASARPRKSRSSTRLMPSAGPLEDGSIIDAKRKRGRAVVVGAERSPKRQRVRDPPTEVMTAGSLRTRVVSGVGSSSKLSKYKTTPASSLKKSSSPGIESSKALPAISTRSLRSNDSVTRSGRLRQ